MRFLTEVASDPGLEPGALRLGVLKNFQNSIKISDFRTFLGVLSNILHLNRLFSFVFSANFRFQNNFQTKIIPKTIPIFIAVFKKSNAKRHLFFVVVAITADLCYPMESSIFSKCIYWFNCSQSEIRQFWKYASQTMHGKSSRTNCYKSWQHKFSPK